MRGCITLPKGFKTKVIVRPESINIVAKAADGRPSKLEMEYILLHTLPTELGTNVEKVQEFINRNGVAFLDEEVKESYSTINGSLVRVEHNPKNNIAANIDSKYMAATKDNGGYVTVKAMLDLEAVDEWVLSALQEKKAAFSMEVYFGSYRYLWVNEKGEIQVTDFYPLGGDGITMLGYVASGIAEFSGSAVTLNPADTGAILLSIGDPQDDLGGKEEAMNKEAASVKEEEEVDPEANQEMAKEEATDESSDDTGIKTENAEVDAEDAEVDKTDETVIVEQAEDKEEISDSNEEPKEDSDKTSAEDETADIIDEKVLVLKAELDGLLEKVKELEASQASFETLKKEAEEYKELAESLKKELEEKEDKMKELSSQVRFTEVKERIISNGLEFSDEEIKTIASKTDEEVEFFINLAVKAVGSRGKPIYTELKGSKKSDGEENPFTKVRRLKEQEGVI